MANQANVPGHIPAQNLGQYAVVRGRADPLALPPNTIRSSTGFSRNSFGFLCEIFREQIEGTSSFSWKRSWIIQGLGDYYLTKCSRDKSAFVANKLSCRVIVFSSTLATLIFAICYVRMHCNVRIHENAFDTEEEWVLSLLIFILRKYKYTVLWCDAWMIPLEPAVNMGKRW